ncbi:tRNA dihydrouridine synthase [Dispira parvispora]|uniref:tRNA-dihydrouridine(20a/20b) synthase [NAD(P)+] n=1 Tax=Dispira parvispora TaxID=1520584 RepID=A0A9W8AW31_9FUNG|nr:tRNA dihydrouridine synthase [Dispira parvispora]
MSNRQNTGFPNIHRLFRELNKEAFWDLLDGVDLEWADDLGSDTEGACTVDTSTRTTSIQLSKRALQYKTPEKVAEVLARQMVHAYLHSIHAVDAGRTDGPSFQKHWKRLLNLRDKYNPDQLNAPKTTGPSTSSGEAERNRPGPSRSSDQDNSKGPKWYFSPGARADERKPEVVSSDDDEIIPLTPPKPPAELPNWMTFGPSTSESNDPTFWTSSEPSGSGITITTSNNNESTTVTYSSRIIIENYGNTTPQPVDITFSGQSFYTPFQFSAFNNPRSETPFDPFHSPFIPPFSIPPSFNPHRNTLEPRNQESYENNSESGGGAFNAFGIDEIYHNHVQVKALGSYYEGFPEEVTPQRSILQLFETEPTLNVCAPMVRYSKLPFRTLVRQYNVDIVYTPMILADVFRRSDYSRECEFTTRPDETPLVVQFAANDGVHLADAAELVAPWADAIDINCGCPQRWAYAEQLGAYLMEQPELVRDMVRMCKARVNKPCVIKIRVHKDLKKTWEFIKRAEAVGVDWITIHGRTRQQKSTEPVNLDAIKFGKEVASVPVIGNGDIFSAGDAQQMVESTGVNGVMAARGLLQNPALFSGYSETPLECIQKFVDLSIGLGSNTYLFHHHLMFMLENVMTSAERKTFNVLASTSAILNHLDYHYDIRPHKACRMPSQG